MIAGKDVSQKLYAVAEQAALTVTTKDPKQGRFPSLQVGGRRSVGVNSTATNSSLGPWQGELLRSQSADAVHTCKQGQVRSIHWRRDQTRKVKTQKKNKLEAKLDLSDESTFVLFFFLIFSFLDMGEEVREARSVSPQSHVDEIARSAGFIGQK